MSVKMEEIKKNQKLQNETEIDKTEKECNNQIPPYSVEIDFDEASACWHANKKHIGNGTYKYVCGHQTRTGKYCKKPCKKGCTHCAQHSKSSFEKVHL